MLRFETIPDRRSLHEIRELLRVELQVFDIEYAFRQPAEEARHAVLYHLPSRAEQGSVRSQRRPQRDEVLLVASGSVQEEQGEFAAFSGPETMDET